MTNYQRFLEKIGVLYEDLFNEVINSLPKIDFDEVDVFMYDNSSVNELACCIIDYILGDWPQVYSEEVNFDNKSFELNDVESLADLEEIKETFKSWTITNYDELKSELTKEKEIKDERDAKKSLFYKYIDGISYRELENFLVSNNKDF